MSRITNCPNCGAPITGLKCEYCGTQFFDIADMEIGKPGYLRMKSGDSVYTFRAMPTNMDVHFCEPTYHLWANDTPIMHLPGEVVINLEFHVINNDDNEHWIDCWMVERH